MSIEPDVEFMEKVEDSNLHGWKKQYEYSSFHGYVEMNYLIEVVSRE